MHIGRMATLTSLSEFQFEFKTRVTTSLKLIGKWTNKVKIKIIMVRISQL